MDFRRCCTKRDLYRGAPCSYRRSDRVVSLPEKREVSPEILWGLQREIEIYCLTEGVDLSDEE